MTTYCTAADLYSRFGQRNVEQWAELGDGDATTRIDWAIAEAGQVIDETMRGGIYAVPFAAAPSTPGQIKTIATFLAGFELRRIRAVESTPDGEDGFYEKARAQEIMRLKKMARGLVRIAAIQPDVEYHAQATKWNGDSTKTSTT